MTEKAYTLIDTAGVRRRAKVNEMIEKISVIKTLQSIEQCNVVMLVLDAQQGISEQDATLSGHVLESGRALVVVVNKWDGLDSHQRDRIKEDMSRKLPFLDFASATLHLRAARFRGGESLSKRSTARMPMHNANFRRRN